MQFKVFIIGHEQIFYICVNSGQRLMDTTVSELVYSVCRETFTGVSSIRKKENGCRIGI